MPIIITLEGRPGESTPQVYSAAAVNGLRTIGAAAARNVALHYTGSGSALRVEGSAERILAMGGVAACEVGEKATIVDGVCSGSNRGIYANVSIGSWQLTLRNDTIYGSLSGISATAEGTLTISAVNTIVRGVAMDIEAHKVTAGSVAVTLDHSNYANVKGEAGATVTPAGSGTNQIAAPLFVNAGGGDFREQIGSPTIDAGANEAANGQFDLAGSARALPGHLTCGAPPPAITDIGAYELVPAVPPCVPPTEGPKSIAPTIKSLKAKVKAATATFTFKGSGDGSLKFECSLDGKKFRSCKSPKTYHGLKPGKHLFRVRAVGPGGTSAPAKRKFRVPPAK